MAIARVQTGGVLRTVSGLSIAPTLGSVTAGNLVVACLSQQSVAESYTGPGGGWALAVGNLNSTVDVEIWYLPGASNAGGTITPTFSVGTASKVAGFLSEWSGVASTSPLDKTATGTAGKTTTCASGTLSGNTATSVAIAAFCQSITAATITWTPGTGYTNLASDATVSSTDHLTGDYRLLAPVGDSETETSSATGASTTSWAGAIATFLVASVAVTRPINSRRVLQAVNRSSVI